MDSDVRAPRASKGSAMAVNSSASQPAPTPSRTRPPDRTCRLPAAFALTNGCRSDST